MKKTILVMTFFISFGLTQNIFAFTQTQNPANGHWYAAINCGFWNDCQIIADSMGGDLVTINDQDEQTWLLQTFGNSTVYWIGLNDAAQEGNWVWASGEPVTYTHWYAGEPNNSYSCGEDWAAMNWRSTTGDWNDLGTCTLEYSGQAIVESGDGTPLLAPPILWIINPANGHGYTRLDTCGIWANCESQAVSIDGHLVTINDQNEQTWLLGTFGTSTLFWIGLTDQAQEGTWVWASGEPVTYTNWYPGEPNNEGGHENWAIMNFRSFTGQWNDEKPGYTHPAIVENDNILLTVSVSRNPEAGGGVASLGEYETEPDCQNPEGILCGVCGINDCVGDAPYGSPVKFGAFPNTGNAFDRWIWNNGASSSTNNPETFALGDVLNLTAVFKKTFTCTNGSFQQTSGNGGWCTDYVNSEIGINFSGDAYQWWQEAIDGGYATGSSSNPEISAIIVLNDSILQHGHVGIVTGFDATTVTIQDSNWSDPYDFQIRNHTLSRNRSDISGYIYCTPPTN